MNTKVIPFHDDTLLSIKDERTGETYVSMKHICQNIGFDWSNQRKKLKENGIPTDRYQVWGCSDITIPIHGIDQTVIVIPVRNINGWLFNINPEKIRDQKVKEKLIRYQKECFEVLYKYWNEGSVVNPRMSDNPLAVMNPTFDLADSNNSAKLLKIIEALHTANIEREIYKNKLKEVMGSTKSKLIQDFYKELMVTDSNGNMPPVTILYDILRVSGYFRMYKDIPYEKFSNDELFGKVELPKTGSQGGKIIIQELLKAGYTINNERISMMLIENSKTGQKALPMGTTKVNVTDENGDEQKKEKDEALEELKSEPVMTPPFQDQKEECDLVVPSKETIH